MAERRGFYSLPGQSYGHSDLIAAGTVHGPGVRLTSLRTIKGADQ